MMKKLGALLKDESGATMIEYGLIIALIAIACILALQLLGNELSTVFNTAQTAMAN